MIITISLVLLLVAGLCLFARYKFQKALPEYASITGALAFFAPCAAVLQGIIDKYADERALREQTAKFARLYPDMNAEHARYAFMLNRNAMALLFLCAVLMLTLLTALGATGVSKLADGRTIDRPADGMGEQWELTFSLGDIVEHDITFAVRPKRMPTDTARELFDKNIDAIFQKMLNGNSSADHITQPLAFPKKCIAAGYRLEWVVKTAYISAEDGALRNKKVPAEGCDVTIGYNAFYYDELLHAETIALHIDPVPISAEDALIMELEFAVNNAENALDDDQMELPDTVGDLTVAWGEKKNQTAKTILIMGLVACVAVFLGKASDIKKNEKHRERQMSIDYSNIISKMTLLLSAGATVRSAWGLIAKDYETKKLAFEKDRTAKGRKAKAAFTKHYAYEEMLNTVRDMGLGTSEAITYERFGRRCTLIPYVRLSTILNQNLKKGTQGMLPLLEAESKQAFVQRKETAKKLGEEASTKMQGPMMIYLLIVLVIVMFPAFMSM